MEHLILALIAEVLLMLFNYEFATYLSVNLLKSESQNQVSGNVNYFGSLFGQYHFYICNR